MTATDPVPRLRGSVRGFTLIETLLAVTLFSAVCVTVITWMAGQHRSMGRIRVGLGVLAGCDAVAAVLRNDLLLAIPGAAGEVCEQVDAQTLRLLTTHQPGGDAAGVQRVTWHWDGARAVMLRTRAPVEAAADGEAGGATRVVTRLLAGVVFRQETERGLIMEVASPAGDGGRLSWSIAVTP